MQETPRPAPRPRPRPAPQQPMEFTPAQRNVQSWAITLMVVLIAVAGTVAAVLIMAGIVVGLVPWW